MKRLIRKSVAVKAVVLTAEEVVELVAEKGVAGGGG